MNTSAQHAPDFKGVTTAAFEIFEMTSKPWMDMIEGVFAKTGNGGNESRATWPAREIMKLWTPWESGILKNVTTPKPELRSPFVFCLEQQKHCFSLALAWFDCNTKMAEAIRIGAKHHKDPVETLKVCQEATEECARACTAFIESEFNQFFQACGFRGTTEASKEKNEAVKSRTQGQAKV